MSANIKSTPASIRPLTRVRWIQTRISEKRPCAHRQRGLSMVLVMILLIITSGASTFFFNSMVGNTRLSGANRDNAASLLLAESAMEMLRGSFINNLDTDPATVDTADKVDTNSARAHMYQTDLVGTDLANLGYIYFVNNGVEGGITEKMPSILQKVANGEAAGLVNSTTRISAGHMVASKTAKLNINDLFGQTFKPFIHKTNANGLLVDSTAASWSAEAAPEKAAAWLELTQNDTENAMDVWVQAVGQVGYATSYLQRYVGTFYRRSQIGGLGILIEGSNIDRRLSP